MGYENMSDFEINKRVAEWCLNATRTRKSNDKDDSVIVVGEKIYSNFDPCGNWSHSGPIIQSCKVCLSPIGDYWTAVEYKSEKVFKDKNPLRAACIVYLMMQEAKC